MNDAPTAGDYAWSQANDTIRAVSALAKRVAYLEEQLNMRYEPPAPKYKPRKPFAELVEEKFKDG